MKINIKRLKHNLLELSQIGKVVDNGITRLAFSRDEKQAQMWLCNKLKAIGVMPHFDSVGNLIADYPGFSDKYIGIGSHLDTVPNGGMFDGALGVVSALECLTVLIENNVKLYYGIRLIAFIAEEGSDLGGTFGSRCMCGHVEMSPSKLDEVDLTSNDVQNALINKEELISFLELHIEQGAVLDSHNKSIGIVTGIVGIKRYNVIVEGTANHAGTTPMGLRDDALVKACKIILRFYDLVEERKEELVGTVGKLEVIPGAVNVVPGRVNFTIELRSMKEKCLEEVIVNLKQEYSKRCCKISQLVDKRGVFLNRSISRVIENAIQRLGYGYSIMTSGAGHDACAMSHITPTGMIFVPSINGISHAPEERTSWLNVEQGANVLLNALLIINNYT